MYLLAFISGFFARLFFQASFIMALLYFEVAVVIVEIVALGDLEGGGYGIGISGFGDFVCDYIRCSGFGDIGSGRGLSGNCGGGGAGNGGHCDYSWKNSSVTDIKGGGSEPVITEILLLVILSLVLLMMMMMMMLLLLRTTEYGGSVVEFGAFHPECHRFGSHSGHQPTT